MYALRIGQEIMTISLQFLCLYRSLFVLLFISFPITASGYTYDISELFLLITLQYNELIIILHGSA
jgi:hypothetical protein